MYSTYTETQTNTHIHIYLHTPALGDANRRPRRCFAEGEACESKVSVFSKRCRSVRPWWCARSLQKVRNSISLITLTPGACGKPIPQAG